MRSCSAHNDYKGVWVASEALWWHLTTESVLTHSEKHNWAATHRSREEGVQKNAQQCDITGRSSSPQSTRMYREEAERQKYTEWFVQNQISSMHNSFLDFYFSKNKMRLCLTKKWHVSELDMLAWSSTIFMQRWGTWVEKTFKWLPIVRGMICLGRMSL